MQDSKDDTDNLANDMNVEKYSMTNDKNRKPASSTHKSSITGSSVNLAKNIGGGSSTTVNGIDSSGKDNITDATSKLKSESMKRARVDAE